jgi:hypothetical protein
MHSPNLPARRLRQLPGRLERADLLPLLAELAEGNNGVHLRDLAALLLERGFGEWSNEQLRAHLEDDHDIRVRSQLKVRGINRAGIHWNDLPCELEEVTGGKVLRGIPWNDRRCTGRVYGRRCADAAVMTEPVPLCAYHRWEVAVAEFPGMAEQQRPEWTSGAGLVASAAAVPADLDGPHDEIVYFLVNGDRVKIGRTINLAVRVKALALPRSGVALVLQGGRSLETALHDHFAAYRVEASEWFRLEGPLVEYVAAKTGAPGAFDNPSNATGDGASPAAPPLP